MEGREYRLELLEKLKGIPYHEWIRIRDAIDKAFEHHTYEFQSALTFTDESIAFLESLRGRNRL